MREKPRSVDPPLPRETVRHVLPFPLHLRTRRSSGRLREMDGSCHTGQATADGTFPLDERAGQWNDDAIGGVDTAQFRPVKVST